MKKQKFKLPTLKIRSIVPAKKLVSIKKGNDGGYTWVG